MKMSPAGLAYLEHVGAMNRARSDADTYLNEVWKDLLARFAFKTGTTIEWASPTLSGGGLTLVSVSVAGGCIPEDLQRVIGVWLRDYRQWDRPFRNGRDVQVIATLGNQRNPPRLRGHFLGRWDRMLDALDGRWIRDSGSSCIFTSTCEILGCDVTADVDHLMAAAAEVMEWYEKLVTGSAP